MALAAGSTSLKVVSIVDGLAGFTRTAILLARGANSRSSSSRFEANSPVAVGLGKAFLDQDFKDARYVLDTNVTGTIYLIHKVGRD